MCSNNQTANFNNAKLQFLLHQPNIPIGQEHPCFGNFALNSLCIWNTLSADDRWLALLPSGLCSLRYLMKDPFP